MSCAGWAVVKVGLKKIWVWCKKYWQILLAVSISVFVLIFTRRSPDLSKVLQRVRDDHQKDIDVINKAHEKEVADREAAHEKYMSTVEEVEKKYREASENLSSKKRSEIEKIIKIHSDDPDEITRRLAEITGFEILVK